MKQRERWEYAYRTNASGVVALVPVTDAGELVLVEQYRIPVESKVLELPAGLAGDDGDMNESLSIAAQRELLEETGYRAEYLEKLLTGPSTAGMADEVITMYYAGGLKRVGSGGGDGNENIKVYHVPLESASEWLDEQIAKGSMVDFKVYAGLFWAAQRYRPS